MGDFYIVARRKFVGHKTFEIAEKERARLTEQFGPDSLFRIYRCKTSMKSDGMFARLEAFVRAAAAAGDADASALVDRIDAHEKKLPSPHPPIAEAA